MPNPSPNPTDISTRSWVGLNSVNFFLAELVGVILPFLSDYLKQKGWDYDTIGMALAVGGLGTFLMQIPAGIISDRIECRRRLLGGSSLILGLCYAFLPLAAGSVVGVTTLLFISSAANAFFVPLLAALALALVGHKAFDRAMGVNQGWNHAGNIAAALLALLLVHTLGVVSIFYVMALISVFAAASLTLIRQEELNPDLAIEKGQKEAGAPPHHLRDILQQVKTLLSDKVILCLVVSVTLFHLANAPVMPLVALYLKHLGGNDDQIALVVLVAQLVMIPVALLAGKFCSSHGRKPVFALAFLVLPLRIFLYSMTTDPHWLLAIQALDGIGAGIYGVVIALICADLTQGKQGFNTLLGILQTALALGAVLGPFAQGMLTQHLGFVITFWSFAAVAALGAVIFLCFVPETKRAA